MKRNHAAPLLIAVALLCCAPAPYATHAQDAVVLKEGRVGFSDNEKKVTVTIDGELFTEYIYDGSTKPYLYPIIGPTGASMTRHYPMKEGVKGESKDHPHHTSLWFAHGNVNGVDFWHPGKNSGVIRQPQGVVTAGEYLEQKNEVLLADSPDWFDQNDNPLLYSMTVYHFKVLPDKARVIDVVTKMSNSEQDVTFGDTKEGTMAIRLHPALNLKGDVATGKCINSEGDKDGACWGKRAKWVAYWGVIDGKTCGVAIFDHPTNLRHPTWWHARDYGLVAANPFGISDFEKKPKGTGDFTLKQGEKLNLRYRFVFFAGTAEEADIKGKYEQWVKETMPEDKQEAGKE